MCYSVADGGQRCAGHTRPRYVAARDAITAANGFEDRPMLEQFEKTAVEYATTVEGERTLLAEAADVGRRGDYSREIMLKHFVARGQMLREVNAETAGLIRAEIDKASAVQAEERAAKPIPDRQGPCVTAADLDAFPSKTFIDAGKRKATTTWTMFRDSDDDTASKVFVTLQTHHNKERRSLVTSFKTVSREKDIHTGAIVERYEPFDDVAAVGNHPVDRFSERKLASTHQEVLRQLLNHLDDPSTDGSSSVRHVLARADNKCETFRPE